MIQHRNFSIGCIGLFLITVVGCGSDFREEESAESVMPTTTFSEEQTSYTQAGEIEDLSYGGVKRVSQRIVVPLGRTREQLTATLNHAAQKLMHETKANAVNVFAYRPQDNSSGQYSAGQATYAPNGRWEDADSSAPMQVSVDLNDLYFDQPNDQIVIGDAVRLKDSKGELIELSNEYGSWADKDIIVRVSAGTEAKIVERRAEPIGNEEFVRYRVRVTDHGSEVSGWVFGYNVESP